LCILIMVVIFFALKINAKFFWYLVNNDDLKLKEFYFMKVSTKIILITGGLSTIILAMFLVTWWVTDTQKSDGASINLAGRQRMLSQKMTKELLNGFSAKTKIHRKESFASAKNSMLVFDKTLTGLITGKNIPLTLDSTGVHCNTCLPAEGESLSLLNNVVPIWKEFNQKMENVISGATSADSDLVWIKANNTKLLSAMNKAVLQMQKDAESSVRLLISLQLIGFVTAIVLLCVSILVIRKLIHRLNLITEFAGTIGGGDLSQKSGIVGQDEIGIIGQHLDSMSQNLNAMFGRISENSTSLSEVSLLLGRVAGDMSDRAISTADISVNVAASAEEMSANMSTVAAATEEAATNISLVSSATDEMTSNIVEIAKNTEHAQKISGEAVVEANSASEKVDELGQAANEIGKVTETITEISEQTNLLALNATIEAARAGDAGKGFAVVANEIKELAKQTADATQAIKTRIDDIQHSTAGTVTQIQQITQVINEVNNIVSTITSSVEEQSITTNEIAENISQAAIGINEVTENVAQLSTVSEEVARDMSQVSEHSRATSDTADGVKGNGVEIQNLATVLGEMVAKIKL